MAGRIWPIVGSLLLATCGCLGPFFRNSTSRDVDKDLDISLIASVTDRQREDALNSAPLQVSGVGLVTGLDGTGDSPQGPFREMLERELRKQKIEHVREILDSRDNALVLVSAILHSGMRKHDKVDVEITFPPGSRATSLRGGILHDCYLRNYQMVRTGIGDFNMAENKLLAGDIMVRAGGPLLVGLNDAKAGADLKRGCIWEGGILLADRPFYLVLKHNEKSAHVAYAVAERLNGLFREGTGRSEIARPAKELIALHVPMVYSLNPERFLRVTRLVPLRENAEQQLRYGQKLVPMLLDPKDSVRTALRLEALGSESGSSSINTLKTGLDSTYPLVRFASAEALIYLGNTEGADELAKIAQKHRQLRYGALLALASLNEAACRNRLADLLELSDPELRYGAFRAFRWMGRTDPEAADGSIVGQKLGTFWLHRVAPNSAPLVHLSTQKRAEIVLFGRGISLRPPFGISAGADFTITARGSDQCVVSRVPLRQETVQRPALLQLDDILRKMVELGAQYPDVVDFLCKAERRGCLSCPLGRDALPEAISMDVLADAGRDASFLRE